MAPSRTQETIEQSDYFTTEEAANVLGVSIKTIQTWTNNDKINFIRTDGGHRRIPKSEIERLTKVKGGVSNIYNIVEQYKNTKNISLNFLNSFKCQLDNLIQLIEEDEVETFNNIFDSFDNDEFKSKLSNLVFQRNSMNESVLKTK